MKKVMKAAHVFLQNFCLGNPDNQALMHKYLDHFLKVSHFIRTCDVARILDTQSRKPCLKCIVAISTQVVCPTALQFTQLCEVLRDYRQWWIFECI